MEREALKLALEALESDYTFEWPAMHRPKKAEKKRFEAITSIKKALAQPEVFWIGLTDEEVHECYESVMFNLDIEPSRVLVYQAIEAKLKEKNT